MNNGYKAEFNETLTERDWESIRQDIYCRDNYKCKKCGVTCLTQEDAGNDPELKQRGIQCHHIIPWEISKDDKYENLVTLCRKCHLEIEQKIRKGNTDYYGLLKQGDK